VATNSSPAEPVATIEVAVIGSARIGADDSRYDDAVRLGAALAGEGWTVVTGGYGGLMGATASGARSAGGHTVGLPMRPWDHLTPSEGHAELRWSEDYSERMRHLLSAAVVVGLPGGVGTLAEATGVWAAAQTEPGAAALVLVGAGWRRVLETLGDELVIDDRDLGIAHLVDRVEDVPAVVHRLIAAPEGPLGARG
jgi:uncharacterized protein (TIGR00730 family)